MQSVNLPSELLELALQHGIDLDGLSTELTDEELEAVVGGKQRIADRRAEMWASVMHAAALNSLSKPWTLNLRFDSTP